jgi:peptidoglycan/xylan/chitin deacetylase (PgdA/CDA1 family)
MRGMLAGLALLVLACAGPAAAEDVALTFDDLPSLTGTPALAYQQETTTRLLAALRHHHIPAIGFVNEIKLEGADKPARIALLSQWLDAGMDLGNHSYSHVSLTKTPLDAYIADVARGETVTRALMAERGRAPHWYRHPYLETGPTPEIRKGFEDWLAAHGYRVAPVTMENSDYLFALPYDAALLKGDQAQAARIQQAYLDFTARIVPWYQQAATDVLGRRPAFVFLLHATRLNADSLDGLAAILKADKLHPVTIARAVADPAYSTPDDYTGPDGNEWLMRWALTLHKQMPWSILPKPPADIVSAGNDMDDDPHTPVAAQGGL